VVSLVTLSLSQLPLLRSMEGKCRGVEARDWKVLQDVGNIAQLVPAWKTEGLNLGGTTKSSEVDSLGSLIIRS